MVTVKINPAITRTETIIVEPKTVTLTISMEEAQMLLNVTGHCNGPNLYDVYCALSDAGFKFDLKMDQLPTIDLRSVFGEG